MRINKTLLIPFGYAFGLVTSLGACGSDKDGKDSPSPSADSAGAAGDASTGAAGDRTERDGTAGADIAGAPGGTAVAGAGGGTDADGTAGSGGTREPVDPAETAGVAGMPEAPAAGAGGQSGGGEAGAPGGGEAGGTAGAVGQAGSTGEGGGAATSGEAIAANGTWELVGERGFAETTAMSTGLRNIDLIMHENDLYVGYVVGQNNEAHVWRYAAEENEWEDLGRVSDAANRVSLTVDSDSGQVVAAVDEIVMRYNGSSWDQVGEGGAGEQGAIMGTPQGLFLAWESDDHNLAVDRLVEGQWWTSECSMTRRWAEQFHLAQSPNGRLYASAKLLMRGAPTKYGAVVYELNEGLGAWRELAGSVHDGNEVYDHDIAVSAAGFPYLVYGDFLGDSFSVVRYDGEGDWTYVGEENILGNMGYHPTIGFAPGSSVPVVAYTETIGGDSGYPRVVAFSDGAWVHLGDSYALSDEDMSADPSLAFGDDGSIYVAYWDYLETSAITVKRYSAKLDVSGDFAEDLLGGGDSAVATKDAPTAAWPVVGEFGFTTDLPAGIRGDTALTIDGEDQLYAGYIAASSTTSAGVWKFDGTQWSDLGDVTDDADHSYGLQLVHAQPTLYAAVSPGVFSYGDGAFSALGDLESDGKIAVNPEIATVYSAVYSSADDLLEIHQYADDAWTVHSSISIPEDDFAQHHSLAVGEDGTLFLVYNLQNARTLYLMRHTGSDWEVLDTPVEGPDDSIDTVELVLSPSGVPHLIVKERHATTTPQVSANDLSVLRFEDGIGRWLQRRSILWGGGTSGDEGQSGVEAPTAAFTSDGTLYVAYTHNYAGTGGGPIHVLRYDEQEDEFVLVGGRENVTGNSDALAGDAQLVVDSQDRLYLGYQDGNSDYRLTVRRLVTW